MASRGGSDTSKSIADATAANTKSTGEPDSAGSFQKSAGEQNRERFRELAEVSRLASECQQRFEFTESMKHWQRVVEILTELHGAESWQTRNAVEFQRICQWQSRFNQPQREQLLRLLQLQEGIAQNLQQNRIAEALAMSREATQLATQLYAEQPFFLAKQMLQLGRCEHLNGNFAVAFGHYQESLRLLTEHFGERHPDVEALYGYLGETALAQRENLLAIDYYKAAGRLAEELWGKSSLEVALRANELGVAFHRLRDFPTATKLHRTAESIRREKLGPDHPLVGHSLYNLAVIYLDTSRLDLAEQCLGQALEIFRKQYPQGHPVAWEIQHKLATTWMLQGKVGQAETALKELVDLGNRHTIARDQLLLWRYRLAIACAKQQKYDAAESILVEVLAEQERSLGAVHEDTVRTRNALATLYAQTNRRDLADQLGNQVIPAGYRESTGEFKR